MNESNGWNLRRSMPHQDLALSYARSRDSVALFMEMRLGKSLVAIRWALSKKPSKVLVVGPLSVLPGWASELEMEGVKRVQNLREYNKSDRLMVTLDGGWFLLNYEAVRIQPEILMRVSWDVLIVDESTRIKNPNTKITKLMTLGTNHINNKAILSGLPAPESPLDYFCQMKFLFGSFMGCKNYYVFRGKYFRKNFLGWDWTTGVSTITRIKKEVHRLSFVMTRKRAGIGSKKIYEKRYVDMNKRQKKEHKNANDHFFINLQDGQEIETKWAIVRVMWMARIAGGFLPEEGLISSNKINELIELLKGELSKEQVVVWFRFNNEIKAVYKMLRAKKIVCDYMTGSVSLIKRKMLQKKFKEGRLRVLLMQYKIGKFGLDLSAASTTVYYSNAYNLEDRDQSEDRIIHPKKSEPLLYIDLISKESIDEEVVDLLRQKGTVAKHFMTQLVERWKIRHGVEKSKDEVRKG